MSDVASLINKSNMKKLTNHQRIDPCKCNCINKTNCLLKTKCQFNYIAYKVEVYSHELNNSNVSRNVKKCIHRFHTGTLQKRYYNHRSCFAYKIYRHRTSLSNDVWEMKNLVTDLILKWKIVKKNAINIKWEINIAIYVWRRNFL